MINELSGLGDVLPQELPEGFDDLGQQYGLPVRTPHDTMPQSSLVQVPSQPGNYTKPYPGQVYPQLGYAAAPYPALPHQGYPQQGVAPYGYQGLGNAPPAAGQQPAPTSYWPWVVVAGAVGLGAMGIYFMMQGNLKPNGEPATADDAEE